MKSMNNTPIILGSIDPETDLEWMLQSEKVPDSTLIRALVHDYYPQIYRLAALLIGENKAWQAANPDELKKAAREIAEQALIKVVMNRHRYWGDPELTAWIMGLAVRFIRKAAPALQASVPAPLSSDELFGDKKNSVSSDMEKSVAGLDIKRRLLLLLRYTYKLGIPSIAHVLGAAQKSIQADLQTTREAIRQTLEKYEHGLINPAPELNHRHIHHLLQSDIDSFCNPDEQESIKQHLNDCPACRAYAAGLDQFEKRLADYFQTNWSDPLFPENEEALIAEETTRRMEDGGIRRKMTIHAKESAIVGLIILVVLTVGWGIKIMAPNADQPAPPKQEVAAASVQSLAVKPSTSISVTDALTTTNPGDFRPWFNSNAIIPPKAFINLEHTVLITEPVTDTDIIRQSGSNSMDVMVRFWGSVENSTDGLLPGIRRVNMSPFDIVRFINSSTNLRALSRVGGDINTLKRFVAAGFPIIIERGVDGTPVGGVSDWNGTFDVVNGYDDAQQSISMLSSYRVPGIFYANIYYGSFEKQWQAFNYEYLVIYKPVQEEMVNQILGSQANTVENYHQAAQKASIDAYNSIYVRDQFFAWFNTGLNLTYLHNYTDAVTTFDQAFIVYKKIPEAEVPWRMFWYQTDFYQAYFGVERYQDVIDLATMILNGPGNPQNEMSYYWRALAEEKLGQKIGAMQDLEASLRINPKFDLGITQLAQLKSGS
jgi:DNA-directed RNA polymerase specialized sigma24 family protein